MPKKILSLFLILCLTVSMTGCHHALSAGTTSDTQTTTAATESSSAPETETSAPQTEPSTEPVTEPETEPTTEPETEPTTKPETQPETEPETEPEETDLSNLWTPLCDYYINLRKTPGGAILCQIPLGKTFKVLGWYGQYALVEYRGKQGYVTANYIQPADENYFTKRLQVVTPTIQYTYAQTLSDMQALQAMYPNLVRLDTIGKSELGLDIPVMILGNPNAPKHVLMQGAMHGREHFTAWLLMAIADNSLAQGYLSDQSVCYHIIPMSNPDGVIVSQTEALDDTQRKIYQQDRAYGYSNKLTEYARQWKANGLGIDLNRNFPSGWSVSKERNHPSSSRYRGESPLCAAESKALANYTTSRDFAATLSFHSHGSVLYYRYGNRQPVNNLSYDLALAVQAKTGYIPVQDDGTTGAGYKDWAMDALGIPSLTIEIGSSETPIIRRDMYNTYARFEQFLPTISAWLAK